MDNKQQMQPMKKMSYNKFILMMVISFVIMYSVMFLNVDELNHIYISETRIYMALLMISPMAVVRMAMMGRMYPDKKVNTYIIGGAIVLFGVVFAALRTQTPVGDVQYMKAMIPHHSSAIMVSKHANIQDPEVKKLSEEIIRSQEEEIAQMKAILQRMK